MSENNLPLILIVDDNQINLKVLGNILIKDDYEIAYARSGVEALDFARKHIPDLILLDIMMPDMDGYDVCKLLKVDLRTRNIPIIFVTAKDQDIDESKGFEYGAVDYITKPVRIPIVQARVKTHIQLHNQNLALEKMVKARTAELDETRLEIIRRLGRAAEYKDNETGMHVIRMSKYCYKIAVSIGMADAEADLILNAAPMHDIGKIGIPDSILTKPGPLDAEEWKIMKRHCKMGADIIAEHPSELLTLARTVALTHHEKWNGSGYPQGLSGEKIPLEGRIVALADVFDALTSKRPYKEEWKMEDALDFINMESGEHFDPALVPAFFKALPEIKKIKEEYKD